MFIEMGDGKQWRPHGIDAARNTIKVEGFMRAVVQAGETWPRVKGPPARSPARLAGVAVLVV